MGIHLFVHLTTVAISLLGLVVSPFSSSCNYLILSLAHIRPKSVAATQLLSNGHRIFRVFLSIPRQHRRAACPAFNSRATSKSTPLLLNVDFLIKLNKASSMWRKQSRAQKAAAEAAELRIRAKKALEDAE